MDEKCLVDSKTGKIVKVECLSTLAIMHSYLKQKKHCKAAKQLLEDAFNGKKVIQQMTDEYQKVKK